MSNNPEVFTGNQAETNSEIERAASERAAELQKTAENRVERSGEHQTEAIEKARSETQEALLSKERGGAEKKSGGEPSGRIVRKVTKKDKEVVYQQTLKEIRTQMNAPSRTFSKIIHNRVVEQVSDIAGNTIARPNAIISGSTVALILVSLVYVIAKKYGYPMSGFETIGAFIIGWLIGVIYDYAKVTISGGKSRS